MRTYTFVDYITQGYLALIAMLVLVGHGTTVPSWKILIGAHLLALGIIHCLLIGYAARPDSKTIALFRHFYPVLLYAGFYSETGWLNQMFVHGYLDPVIIRWDQTLFQCQPSLDLMKSFPFLPVSELFYAAYFSYYLMIGGVGFALYFRDRSQFFHYVSVVSFVFYICYLIYIFVPVIGPPVFFEKVLGYSLPEDLQRLAAAAAFPEQVKAGMFFNVMKWIYRIFESPGAAIPSSHVAIALCTVSFSFMYLRKIRWYHLGLTILLCIATVYCRYHYACDVLAGAATALLLVPLGNRLYRKLEPEFPLQAGRSSVDVVGGSRSDH